jgi:hypothetical protein
MDKYRQNTVADDEDDDDMWVLPPAVFNDSSTALNNAMDMMNAAIRFFTKGKMINPKAEKQIDALIAKAKQLVIEIDNLNTEAGNNLDE